MRQGFGGDGLAKGRGGETPVHTDSWKVLPALPISFHPAQTSHMFLIFPLTPASQNMQTVKSGKKRGCWQDTVQKKDMRAKTGKSIRKLVKKQVRSTEKKNWNLSKTEKHAGIPTLVCKQPWNSSSLLCTVGFCGSWHASSSGVYVDGAKPPTQLIDYRDITWYHKMAFLIYWLDLLLQKIPPTHTRYPKKNTDEVAKSSQLEGSCLCNHHAAYLAPTLQHSLRAWPTSVSILLNAYDWSALGKCVGREAHQWKVKLKGYQYIIHSEHEPENSRLLLPLPPGYLYFTILSGTEQRNSSPRAPLPFFSETVTMCLSQMGPLSPTSQQAITTNLHQSHIALVATFFHRMQLLKESTKVHGECARVAQLHLSKFPAWQLGFHFYLASTSHPEKPLCPVLEE